MEPAQEQKKEDQVANVYGKGGKNKQKKKAEKFLQKDHSDTNMLVSIRIRPLNQREIGLQDYDIIRTEDKLLIVLDKVEVECENEGKKPEVLHRSREQRYYFDRIFPKETDTNTVYQNTCSHLIDSVMKGYNACVFAYGTTGSGKTYTMAGTQENPGIMYLIIKGMFDLIQSESEKSVEIKVSYVEIYNEVIRDLLVANSKETYLDLRDDPERGVCIAGVTEFQVQEPDQVMSLLQIGNKRRTTEATNANQTSSRSHAIFQISLGIRDRLKNTENQVLCGKLSLIDLAGSERGTVTENRGLRLREGAKINTSLLALANCINALGDKTKKGFFVPFRDSKLTRMLKDSLGGNCKTVMIATISPASSQNEETINTLKYANRAKNIKMRVEPNKKMVYLHISAYKSIIADLRDEIDKLKLELSVKGNEGSILKQPSDIQKIDQVEIVDFEESKQQVDLQPKTNPGDCKCDVRRKDDEEKIKICTEIAQIYEDIIQLEQALIELDEQNTLNALEIKKREAKVFILSKQLEEIEEQFRNGKENIANSNNGQDGYPPNEIAFLQKHIAQHTQQIEILSESTKQNLIKRQQMKNELYENYQQIKQVRLSIEVRIQTQSVKDYLELVIKNNFLESQNVQLLLNLQLQARTIIDLKNMISKQQKYIEENDIGINATDDKNADLFLDGPELEFEDQDAYDEQYISDFNMEDRLNQQPIADQQIVQQQQLQNPVQQPVISSSKPSTQQKKPETKVSTDQSKKKLNTQNSQKKNDNNSGQQNSAGGLSIVGSGMQKNNSNAKNLNNQQR